MTETSEGMIQLSVILLSIKMQPFLFADIRIVIDAYNEGLAFSLLYLSAAFEYLSKRCW